MHLEALDVRVSLCDSLITLSDCRHLDGFGAVRIIERRKVLVFGSDRGDYEGFLTFSQRRAKRYSSGLLMAFVILILCWLCGTLVRVWRVMLIST